MANVYPPKQIILRDMQIFSAISKSNKEYYYVETQDGQRFILPPFVSVDNGFVTLIINLNQDNTYYIQYM